MHYNSGLCLTLEDSTVLALDIYGNMFLQILHADPCFSHKEQNLDS